MQYRHRIHNKVIFVILFDRYYNINIGRFESYLKKIGWEWFLEHILDLYQKYMNWFKPSTNFNIPNIPIFGHKSNFIGQYVRFMKINGHVFWPQCVLVLKINKIIANLALPSISQVLFLSCGWFYAESANMWEF